MTNPEKAMTEIQKSGDLALTLKFHIDELSWKLETGTSTKQVRTILNDALLDLRLSLGDVDAFVRLMEAERD